MITVKLPLAVALALLSSPAAAEAPLHRWLDEQGQVHYTDRPPEGVPSEKVELATEGERPDRGLRPGEKRLLSEVERREQAQRLAQQERHARRLAEQDKKERQCRDVARALSGRPNRADRSALVEQDRVLGCGVR